MLLILYISVFQEGAGWVAGPARVQTHGELCRTCQPPEIIRMGDDQGEGKE